MANEPLIGGGRPLRGGAALVKDVTHGRLHGRGRRRLVRAAGHRRFLGAVVRPVQAARAAPRKGRARRQRRGAHGQAQHRREPRDRAADAHPVDPGGLCLQGRPAGRRLRRRGAGKPDQAVRRSGSAAAAAARRRSTKRWRWPRRRRRPATTPAPPRSTARSCSTSPSNPRRSAGLAQRADRARRIRRGARKSLDRAPKEIASHADIAARALGARARRAGAEGDGRGRQAARAARSRTRTTTRRGSSWRRRCSARASARRRSTSC